MSRRPTTAAIACTAALAFGAALLAQTPSGLTGRIPIPPPIPPDAALTTVDSSALPSGTSALSGTVTDESSGRPIRRATVLLKGVGNRTTVTDDAGGFVFTSLPAGVFSVGAQKAGYVTGFFGTRRSGTGQTIPLPEGQRLDHVDLKLARSAVITGTVTDANGRVMPNTRMSLLQYQTRNGDRSIAPVPAGGATLEVCLDGLAVISADPSVHE